MGRNSGIRFQMRIDSPGIRVNNNRVLTRESTSPILIDPNARIAELPNARVLKGPCIDSDELSGPRKEAEGSLFMMPELPKPTIKIVISANSLL